MSIGLFALGAIEYAALRTDHRATAPTTTMPDASAPNHERILAIETATRHQAVALIDGNRLCEHRVQRVAFNHGSSLLENVDALLAVQGFELDDVDLFCAGLGPGSFTGLRVGLATAKGLARAANRPIVGISSLAALSYVPARTNPGATVACAIDARRREVYAGAYRWHQGTLRCVIDDCAIDPGKWKERVENQLSGPILQIGDGVERYAQLKDWDAKDVRTLPTDLAPPSAVGLSRLGKDRIQSSGPADLAELEPNYIRPSDAVLPEKPAGPMPPAPETTE